LEKTIPNPIVEEYSQFGKAIAATGNRIWVSAPGYTTPATTEHGEIEMAGIVYCYNPNGKLITTLNTPNPAFVGHFGRALAVNDEYLLVGAPGEDVKVTVGAETTTIRSAGHVYLFSKTGVYIKTLISPAPQTPGQFGNSVAFMKGYYIVGAPEETATVHSGSTVQTYFLAGQTHILR
jgi:hypothetical protein